MDYYLPINSPCSDSVSIQIDKSVLPFFSSLGDIVVPGAFIALLLRYDVTRKKGSSRYFTVSFLAYIIALVVTILILQIFKHAQPALLYIVPLCLIFPLATALVLKDWSSMFAYEDHPSEKKNE